MTDQIHEDRLKFLERKLAHHIDDYRSKRNWNRSGTTAFAIVTAVIAAVTTILLGLKSNDLFKAWDPHLSAGALILSALTALIATSEAILGPRWKWVRYRTTLTRLYDLKDELDYEKCKAGADRQVADTRLDEIYARLMQILEETNTEWTTQRGRATPVSR